MGRGGTGARGSNARARMITRELKVRRGLVVRLILRTSFSFTPEEAQHPSSCGSKPLTPADSGTGRRPRPQGSGHIRARGYDARAD